MRAAQPVAEAGYLAMSADEVAALEEAARAEALSDAEEGAI